MPNHTVEDLQPGAQFTAHYQTNTISNHHRTWVVVACDGEVVWYRYFGQRGVREISVKSFLIIVNGEAPKHSTSLDPKEDVK